MQMDVTSLQAQAFMRDPQAAAARHAPGAAAGPMGRPLHARLAGGFSLRGVLPRLFCEVFGAGGLGQEVAGYLLKQTGMTVAFFWLFDRVLLAETSPWFAGRTREALYRQTAAEALAVTPRPWGQSNRYVLRHILLGGKLPRFFGFDRGPVSIAGGRATIHQAQIFRHGGRTTSFVPSLRVVVDLAGDEIQSSLAGGPSDRRFSRWYACELADWLAGRYKRIRLDPPRRRAFP